MSNTASAQVAIQAGLSPITVRRRARRIIDALAAAHVGSPGCRLMLTARTEKLPFRVIEVMNVNQINPDRSRAGIGSLFDPAGQGEAAIRRLDGCVAPVSG